MPALRILLLLAVAGTVTASPEALKSYKNELKQTRKLDKKFWQEFKGNWRNAYAALDAPLDRAQAKPSLHREAVRDFAQIDDLYSEFAGIEESRGKAAIAFAKSGHEKALEMLFKELLDLAKEIDKLEEELSGSRVSGGRYIFDQRPGIRRHGLGHYEPLLVEALAHAKGAAAFLSSAGMDKAARKDGRNSIVRRVAVLDALGRLPQGERSDAAKRAILQAYEKGGSSLRVAAVEALGLWGDGANDLLLPALADSNPIVRRAALSTARGAARGPKWIPALIDGLQKVVGLERSEYVKTLNTLTGQPFGYAPAAWKEWYDTYREDIAKGTFDPEKIEIQEAKPVPVPDPVTFYKVPTSSRGIAFVFDASFVLTIPAEVEFQRTKYLMQWFGANPSWRKQHPSQQMALVDELTVTMNDWPEHARFGGILMHNTFDLTIFGEKKLLGRKAKGRKRFVADVEKVLGDGWCGQFEGLRGALKLGGLDPDRSGDFPEPRIDTVYLWCTGSPRGGRYMSAEAVVAAFVRMNRFRRIVVHSLRIADEKETAQKLMQGLADASGGTYTWLETPPK